MGLLYSNILTNSMKTLVIGANGFLARHLVSKLLALGWDVDCVYHTDKSFIPSQCKSFHIDELPKLKNLYDVVFLLSAFIPYGSFNIQDKRLLDVNIKIPLKVTNKFKKSKIIFSSSVSVYGDHNSTIFEDSSFNNPNIYGLSKLAAESILRFHGDYQIIRFSSIYGKGMNSKTFITKVMEEAKKNKKITLFGNGSRMQDYLYIDDAINYLIAVSMCKESGIYLGVFGKSYSNTDVAKVIQKFIKNYEINYIDEDNSSSFVYNNSLTRKLLKFRPQYSLEEGIEDMLKNG